MKSFLMKLLKRFCRLFHRRQADDVKLSESILDKWTLLTVVSYALVEIARGVYRWLKKICARKVTVLPARLFKKITSEMKKEDPKLGARAEKAIEDDGVQKVGWAFDVEGNIFDIAGLKAEDTSCDEVPDKIVNVFEDGSYRVYAG